MENSLKILGIESSCDDTAAAVINVFHSNKKTIKAEIKSSIVFDQKQIHNEFGGVVPELAARAHSEKLDLCVKSALAQSGENLNDINLISVTSGPGLIGGLISGVTFAKALAFGLSIPVVGVNHLVGHALTPRLTHVVEYPYLILIASGGHCQFIIVYGPSEFTRLGGTIDDAPGEAFDKAAKLLGLEYPGGPDIEKHALAGDPDSFKLPLPLIKEKNCNLSFSGLKTALKRETDKIKIDNGYLTESDVRNLAASFQDAMIKIFTNKAKTAMSTFASCYPEISHTMAIAGGVAANNSIRNALAETASDSNFSLIVPEPKYCTDNAAMIAYAGAELFLTNDFSNETLVPRPRWPLDKNASPLVGSGKKGRKS